MTQTDRGAAVRNMIDAVMNDARKRCRWAPMDIRRGNQEGLLDTASNFQ